MSQATATAHGTEKSGMRLENTVFWRIKLRLQFTGWLQYTINGLAGLVFLILAGIGWLIGIWRPVLFWLPFAIGAALLLNTLFDIVTLRWGIRPPEAIPAPKSHLNAFDLMRCRRSCRSFQKRNLTDAHREELLDCARKHTQPDRQIGGAPIRLEYIAAPLTVWPSVGGHEFLVAIAPHEYNRLAIIDVGRSLQKVVLQATRMGLATCWIGPGADHQSILRNLGSRFDPEKDHIICVCAVGYKSHFLPLFVRLMQIMQHTRLPLDKLFFADSNFTTPLPVRTAPFSAFGRCYEVCQWAPSDYNSQTTRCTAALEEAGEKQSLTRFDFAAATTSRYYAAIATGIWCANWETGCEALGIEGHFAVLAPEQRQVSNPPALPRYDVSFVLDQPMSA